MPDRRPAIGVVVPVFGHARLIAEALTSLADQQFDGTIVTVVVIDGDPHPETLHTVTAFSSGGERPTYVVYRRNGRLPAARNTGIDFLLEICPDLDAIYLLDADNRLAPHSIAAFWQSLEANPEAAWAYPDIGFFGLTWSASNIDYRETGPRYEPLRHLFGNICEAGSMVRSSVFRQGVRFDESFTSGYEDWEFWLQCLSLGMHGTRTANSGFQYRRRSDSMLADADRVSGDILQRIFAKHGALFERQSIVDKFCDACAPYILLNHDGTTSLLTALGDTFRSGTVTLDDLVETARQRFHFAYLPRYAIRPLTADAAHPRPTIEQTMKLLLGAQQAGRTDSDFNPVSDEAGASYELVPIASLMAGPQPIDPGLSELYAKLSLISRPHRQPLDRRYAGPASFQLDSFVASRLEPLPAPVPQTAPPVAARVRPRVRATIRRLVKRIPPVSKRTLLVDPAQKWTTTPLRSAAHGRFPYVDAPVCQPFDTLDISEARYLGCTFQYYTRPVSFNMDLGPDRRALALIVEDSRTLFYAGELKRYAKAIAYLSPPTLNDAQVVAIRSAEHALAAIVCMPSDAARLRSDGIPAHKIIEFDQFTSFVQRLGI